MNQSTSAIKPAIKAVVWDVGNVLIDWDPRHLYRRLIEDEAEIERFLCDICHYEWNLEQDKGRLWSDAIAEKISQFPDHENLIRAYDECWQEMVSGPITGSVEILNSMREKNIPLYAITNFSREKWDIATELFPFLNVFQGVTVSADVRMLKPDPAIYRHFLSSFSLDPAGLLFIDDRIENVKAAVAEGFHAIRFTDAYQLTNDLKAFELP